jgi:pyridinium-3,5-biscarboxylic acid mononucleotide sulfurtransferase
LETLISPYRRAVLLFSGGLDSSLLLAVAAGVLGPGLTAITLAGPHTAPGELAAAWTLARRLGVRHVVQSFNPLTLPEFRQNRRERCYVCKQAMIARARDMTAAWGTEVWWDGTNVDDLGEFRPGLRALQEAGVASPLAAAGLNKAAIRTLSRHLGLDADRPSQSCLATRFPYDTELSAADLARVGRAEVWLRSRGFSQVRFRVRGDRARLVLAPEAWPAFLAPEVRRRFTGLVAGLGYTELGLDGPAESEQKFGAALRRVRDEMQEQ